MFWRKQVEKTSEEKSEGKNMITTSARSYLDETEGVITNVKDFENEWNTYSNRIMGR